MPRPRVYLEDLRIPGTEPELEISLTTRSYDDLNINLFVLTLHWEDQDRQECFRALSLIGAATRRLAAPGDSQTAIEELQIALEDLQNAPEEDYTMTIRTTTPLLPLGVYPIWLEFKGQRNGPRRALNVEHSFISGPQTPDTLFREGIPEGAGGTIQSASALGSGDDDGFVESGIARSNDENLGRPRS